MKIDDFLLESAILLGVTQKQIDTEFYMLDVFKAVERKVKLNAETRLLDVQVTNSRYMEKEDYKAFINRLTKAAGFGDKPEKFDRNAMDSLHAFTQKTQQGG